MVWENDLNQILYFSTDNTHRHISSIGNVSKWRTILSRLLFNPIVVDGQTPTQDKHPTEPDHTIRGDNFQTHSMWLYLRDFRPKHTKKYWARLFGGPREGDVQWTIRELIPKDNIVRGRNIPFLLLAGIRGVRPYAPIRVLRQFGIKKNCASGTRLQDQTKEGNLQGTTKRPISLKVFRHQCCSEVVSCSYLHEDLHGLGVLHLTDERPPESIPANAHKIYAYHAGQPGHTTDECSALKARLCMMIDDGKITQWGGSHTAITYDQVKKGVSTPENVEIRRYDFTAFEEPYHIIFQKLMDAQLICNTPKMPKIGPEIKIRSWLKTGKKYVGRTT
ncbi:hypothetical protein HAX54_053205 [Datura stramonium]|uniref:Uncharacterized protein n=1 Tax=Datura stramonium TaxID=4076 RepID=A0ABS8T296_DATST|nr:hypothetical protein [Datura stramonium]